MQLKRMAIDISKHVFTLHGVDEHERPVVRRNLKRPEVETYVRKLPSMEVVMEACGSAHHWGRLLMKLGHTVRLIPAQYVTPFVKRAKNDRADAEAINDAASRPGMAAVPGIGPVTAITLALSIDSQQFASGRHFADWLGLTPKEHSTGGKPRMGASARLAMSGCAACSWWVPRQ